MFTVVIIGRKNVGKSTISNRLSGMRSNIVFREPGVTRDRIYGEVEWRDQSFNIIDTGGFFPNEEGNLANKISQQIEYGLDEADLIYFVVDGKSGLKPADEEICKHLRKTNKKILLLVNKIDSKKDEIKAYEFSKLGFEDGFVVSAEAGIGFGDLLDKTLRLVPKVTGKDEEKAIKVLILGRPNAGKSTLLNTITKQERAIVDAKPGTTRDLVNARLKYQNKNMVLIDTCGLKKLSRVKKSIEFYSIVRAIKVVELAEVVILTFDTTQGVVEQDRRIVSLILSKAKALVLAPNKIDLINKKDIRKIVSSTYRSFKPLKFVPIVPISAKMNMGIETLLDRVLDIYRESSKVVDKKTLSTICKNLQPPTGGDILNLKQIGTKPPIFRATLSISIKESYVRYLRNSIRQYFGFSGVPILIKTKIVRRLRNRYLLANR